MQTITYMEVNIFSIVILLLVFASMNYCTKKYMFEQKLFKGLLWSNLLILILDTVVVLLNGKTGFAARETNLLLNMVYYILNPVPCVLWGIYAYYQIYKDESSARKLLPPLLIPAGINAIFAVLSCFYGYEFYIDELNFYHRGRLFWVMAFICYLYLGCTMVFVILNQKRLEKKSFIPVLGFAAPPLIGGIIQIMFYGITLVWNCMAISVLIIFINIQFNQLYTDYLTGLSNRRQLDTYLNSQLEGSCRRMLAGIMIDLDCFKMINDVYGHSAGDRALEDAANILKQSFRRSDMVARYGGDEFVAILEIKDESDLLKAVERFKKNVEEFNLRQDSRYQINFSIGYDVFNYQSEGTIQQFLKHIDELMYEDKKRKKDTNIAARSIRSAQ